MIFWDFNLFCYLCQFVFDSQCSNLFLSNNISLAFLYSDIQNITTTNNCYLDELNLFEFYDKNTTDNYIFEYNTNKNLDEIVDYIEKYVPLNTTISFHITYENIPIKNFNFEKNQLEDKYYLNKIYSYKKSVFKLLPNLFKTTRKIGYFYFDLTDFFYKNDEPTTLFQWIKNYIK